MKNIILLLFLVWAAPLWAGDEIMARAESTAYPRAWLNLDALLDNGNIRVNVSGPFSHGALIYNRTTSEMILVDDLHKMIFPLEPSVQTGLKMMGYMFSSRLKGEAKGAMPSIKLAYEVIQQNARALFNGSGTLQKKNDHMNGYVCDLYEAQAGAGEKRQVWMTSLASTGIDPDNHQTIWSLTQRLVDIFGYELGELGADTNSLIKNYSASQFPIHVGLFTQGKLVSRFKVIQINHPHLGPDVFNPPVGYQMVSLIDLIQTGIKGK